MKMVILILGILFAGLGVYLTAQAWYFASVNHRVEPISYIGPFIAIMGLFRVFRAVTPMAPHSFVRFFAIGVAVLFGYANQLVIKAVYPDASTIDLTTTR